MPLSESDTRAKLLDAALHTHGQAEDLIRREETPGAVEIVDGQPRKQRMANLEFTCEESQKAKQQ